MVIAQIGTMAARQARASMAKPRQLTESSGRRKALRARLPVTAR